jgi:hypothetical protein
MDATTAFCRACNKRFHLSQYSNRFRRASATPIKNSRFCSPRCRQAAYRARAVTSDAEALPLGTDTLRAVTRPLHTIENIKGIRASKTVLGVAIYAPHNWEDRTSSGGVPTKVARLGRSALVRT